MAAPSVDEMEEMQRLSDRYQPLLEGPLVGDKLPMSDLVTEYAQADPRFVAKTHGTVFGYFEAVLRSGDHSFAMQEFTRIKSFEDTMKMAGIDYDLLEGFFDETWTLFQNILHAFEQGQATDAIVTTVFNDENRSNAIVYHFKMMTSAFMALHPDDFEPFLEMSLDQYRQTRIDPTLQEIDQIGLQALTTGVIAPANLAVEVLYLDRSAGDEVTPHEFVSNPANKPAIRLLYRPGHYDLIYKQDESYAVIIANHTTNRDNFDPVQDYMDPTMYMAMFPAGTDIDNGYNTVHPTPSTTSYAYQPNFYMQATVDDTAGMYLSEQCDNPHRQQPMAIPSEFPIQQSHPSSYYQSSPEAYSSPTSPLPLVILPSPPATLPPQPSFGVSTPKDENELLIRHTAYSSVMQQSRGAQRAGMPLDSSQWGTSSQDRAHFSNKNFTPLMYRQ